MGDVRRLRTSAARRCAQRGEAVGRVAWLWSRDRKLRHRRAGRSQWQQHHQHEHQGNQQWISCRFLQRDVRKDFHVMALIVVAVATGMKKYVQVRRMAVNGPGVTWRDDTVVQMKMQRNQGSHQHRDHQHSEECQAQWGLAVYEPVKHNRRHDPLRPVCTLTPAHAAGQSDAGITMSLYRGSRIRCHALFSSLLLAHSKTFSPTPGNPILLMSRTAASIPPPCCRR